MLIYFYGSKIVPIKILEFSLSKYLKKHIKGGENSRTPYMCTD